eukprot:4634663-Pyramimonas_sp.AAC.1
MYARHYKPTRTQRNRRMDLNVQARRPRRWLNSLRHLKLFVPIVIIMLSIPGLTLFWLSLQTKTACEEHEVRWGSLESRLGRRLCNSRPARIALQGEFPAEHSP